jgi:hypothetical protein
MKSVLTKWKCGECDRWFNQLVKPDSMNQVTCPGCKNSHWLMLYANQVEKIKVKKDA